MKIVFHLNQYWVKFEETDYLDPEVYETSENDSLEEREIARINRIVWGKKIYLPKVILEGSFHAD